MRAMVVAGFTFDVDDDLWFISDKHRNFAKDLMVHGQCVLQGERFFLCEDTDAGSAIVGICIADTGCASVKLSNLDQYRERALKALSKANIYIPAIYGIDIYLTVDPTREDV